MKILVTGASGFLGGHLVDKLISKDYGVRALVREGSDLRNLNATKVDLFRGDLSEKESLKCIMDGIDLVVHAGACTSGSWQNYKDSTIVGTKNILELALTSDIKKLVYISSIDVYGVNQGEKDSLINEASLLERYEEKVGPYAKSKILSEKIVQEFSRNSKFPIVIVRPGIIYGIGCKTFLPHIGLSLFGGKVFLKIGRGEKRLPLTHIDNTVEAIVRLLESKNSADEIYNIIDPKYIRQKEYLDLHFLTLGVKSIKLTIPYFLFVAFGFLNEKLGKVPRLGNYFGLTRYRLNAKFKKVCYDGSKIMRQLNWYPQVKLEDGLQEMLNWFKDPK